MHGLGTWVIERPSMSHIDDVIDTSVSTFSTMPPAVTIGRGVVNMGHLITKTLLGMIVLVELFYNM
jgi:hypothetical protein